MELFQSLAILFGVLIPIFGLFAFIYKEMKEWRAETRAETQSIREEISQQARMFRQEMNEQAKMFREEITEQAKRSDRLYQMFVDLLKSQNPKTNP